VGNFITHAVWPFDFNWCVMNYAPYGTVCFGIWSVCNYAWCNFAGAGRRLQNQTHLERHLNINTPLTMLIFLSASVIHPLALAGQSASQDAFFRLVASNCGTHFTGQSSFPEDPGDAFKGKQLVAHIKTCNADEIRIPFTVGEDHSRTWILRRVEGGLQLKHDHRHADGTADEVTLYGGTTQDSGSPLAQSFPADDYTAGLIPEAATNEWFLSFSEDGSELTYYLERHGKPRFRATLKKQEPGS
jgi:hypothetical protein